MSVHNAIRFTPANRKCWTQPAVSINFVVSTVCNKPSSQTIVAPKSAVFRRFFVLAVKLALVLCFLPANTPAEALCQSKNADAHVRIKHIIDGDTVVLVNGERLRLIGIDTPEIGYKGKSSQAGAISARNFLRELLDEREVYSLSYGAERQDRHGRTLGHLFLGDGRNLQALLLAGGYATPLNMPPNIVFSDCYQQQANKAMQDRLGIWKLGQYQAMPASTLTGKERGYHVVYGRITRMHDSPSSSWLNMDQHLAIHINHHDLKYLPDLKPAHLLGRKIQARGMLYRRNKQLRLRIRHHNDLQILPRSTRLE
jgi:endonuclease YncB( thermonuclease family)